MARKLVVQAGDKLNAIKDGLSISRQLFNKVFNLFDSITKALDWKLAKEKDITTKDGRPGKLYEYDTSSGVRVTMMVGFYPDDDSVVDLSLSAKGLQGVDRVKLPQNMVDTVLQKWCQHHKLGKIESAKSLKVTLSRVCAGTEDTINLTAINANYNITAALDDLNNVLDSEEFVDSLTEDEQSFEIVEVPESNEYDVNPIDEVDVNSTYHELLGAAIRLYHDAQSIRWGAKGLQMHELYSVIDNKLWDYRYWIDMLAELVVEKTGQVPHISSYCNSQDAIDTSAGFDVENGIRTFQHCLQEFVSILEGYYVNLDHDIQNIVDGWIRECKKQSDYYMERRLEVSPAVASN